MSSYLFDETLETPETLTTIISTVTEPDPDPFTETSETPGTPTTTIVTVVDSAEIAEYNRGALTTAFRQPATCLSTLTFDGDEYRGMYFGHAGTDYYDHSCYPSSSSSTYTKVGENGNGDAYYYSPAQCPEAWTHAWTFTEFFVNALDVTGTMLFTLGVDTTAVLCCPSGWNSWGGAGHQCASEVQSGSYLYYVTSTLSGNQVVKAKPTISKITSDWVVWGDGIPVWWQSSDLKAFSAATRTATNSTLPASTSMAGSNGISTSGSGGLSKGGKLAIAVTIPLVFIAVILGVFFYFRHRGKQRVRELEEQSRGDTNTPGFSRATTISELDGYLSPNGPGFSRSTSISELEGHKLHV